MPSESEEFDRILDIAIASYSSADPLKGLEERVLQRMTLHRPRSRSKWAAITALAGAAVAIILAITPRTPPAKVAVVAPPPIVEQFPAPARTPRKAGFRSHPTRPAPRHRAAPALSEAERAMVAFAAQHPEEARDAAAWQGNGLPVEIVISPIEIAPLEGESGQ